MRRIWRDHSLSIVLGSLAVMFLITTILTGYRQWLSEQAEPVPIWEFWRWWTYEFTMSVIADILGALFLVVFTKFFYERGSAESND